MSVKARKNKRSKTVGWEVDVRLPLPEGGELRDRKLVPISSKTDAERWGRERQRFLILELSAGRRPGAAKVPTLEKFGPRFIDEYAKANRQKASGIAAKEAILRLYLLPFLGNATPLDAIDSAAVQKLKGQMGHLAPKTVNNALTVLNKLLKTAVEWGVLKGMPCMVRLLKSPKTTARFYDCDAYERLLAAAKASGRLPHLIVLLGGEAGLRAGEMLGLEWRDVNWQTGHLVIERAVWRGIVNAPKGGRLRHIEMTGRLADWLKEYRGAGVGRVLQDGDGVPLTVNGIRARLRAPSASANVSHGVHILRHTYCSHLAMVGTSTKEIQELAGHESLQTTERYMHLSPGGRRTGIALLNAHIAARADRGAIGEQPLG